MSVQRSLQNTQDVAGRRALMVRAAWCIYVGLLLLPFLVLASATELRSIFGVLPGTAHQVDRWFVLTMAYLVLAVPAALFYRRHLWKTFFRGKSVTPGHYLTGMLVLWMTLEVGILVPLIHCEATGSYLPGLVPAIVAYVFFLTLWPIGNMMLDHTGIVEDPQKYQEPR